MQQLSSRTPAGDPAGSGTGALASLAPPAMPADARGTANTSSKHDRLAARRWRPDHLHVNQTPATARLRRAVRAVILADDDRVLLCRFSLPHPAVPAGATVIWAAPGGGIEPGELPLAALRRELQAVCFPEFGQTSAQFRSCR
jgi:NUDIX domain